MNYGPGINFDKLLNLAFGHSAHIEISGKIILAFELFRELDWGAISLWGSYFESRN